MNLRIFYALWAAVKDLWNIVKITVTFRRHLAREYCTERDCSLYTCEDGQGAVKEGDLFTPAGDCNQGRLFSPLQVPEA